jgi:flagellar basal body-associated protein FliL
MADPAMPCVQITAAQPVRWAALLSLAILPAAGCFDAAALRTSRTAASRAARLAEVDLGAYEIALPHLPGKSQSGRVAFHAFGKVDRKQRKDAEKSLRSRNPRLRAEMLTRIRSLSDAELEEPELESLRAEIADVVNDTLDGKEIEVRDVGFYQFSFVPLP